MKKSCTSHEIHTRNDCLFLCLKIYYYQENTNQYCPKLSILLSFVGMNSDAMSIRLRPSVLSL